MIAQKIAPRHFPVGFEPHAPRGAQAQHDQFQHAHGGGQVFHFRAQRTFAGTRVPGPLTGRIGPAPPRDSGGGRRAQPQIIRPLPVTQIVTALEAHASEIGNFVVQITAGFQKSRALHEHNVLIPLGRQSQAFFLAVQFQRRARLQSQAVGGNMVRAHAHGVLEGLHPLAHALAGQAPHQVHVDVGATRLTRREHRVQAVLGPVRPSQQAQHAFIQALDADGQTVHARRQILRHALASPQGFGIGLQGDFSFGAERETAGQALQHNAHNARRQQAGRAPAEKNGLHLGSAQAVAPMGQLQQQGVQIVAQQGRRGGLHATAQRDGMKGAVAAARAAEGNVDINEHEFSVGKKMAGGFRNCKDHARRKDAHHP